MGALPPAGLTGFVGERILVLNPQSVKHLLCGHFNKYLCQIRDRLTLHCGSGTFKKNYHHHQKKRSDGLFEAKSASRRMCCVQLFLLFSLFMKTRNEFSLHPRWEVREGGTCVS